MQLLESATHTIARFVSVLELLLQISDSVLQILDVVLKIVALTSGSFSSSLALSLEIGNDCFQLHSLTLAGFKLELGALLGSIYIVQNFDAVFTITSGALGTANLPYTIYTTFFDAQDYGLASAQGVVVVIGTIVIATFALRSVFSLFKEESR